jgi:hypothetical protein
LSFGFVIKKYFICTFLMLSSMYQNYYTENLKLSPKISRNSTILKKHKITMFFKLVIFSIL